ncbi:MAG: hypothetical protein GPJ54_04235 [Candidatus Heimdallarchaeota archaeon]|nr:hypothetical protein [Candidatus Heimdallarchaeota archaeon]
MLRIEDLEIILADFEGRLHQTYKNNTRNPGSNILPLSLLRSEFDTLTSVISTLEESCARDFSKLGRYRDHIVQNLALAITRLKKLQPLLGQKTNGCSAEMLIQFHVDDIGTELLQGVKSGCEEILTNR